MSRLASSRNSFLDPFGGSKNAKINHNLILDNDKQEESEKVDFVHPSHAKSLFFDPYGGQDRASMRAISEF